MKNMADLDPAEEKLLNEALFETANDDYFEQDFELEGDEEQKRHVPNSKVQFPIRRRRSTFYRKLFCFGVFLALLGATVVGIYFLLKSRTVSLELKIKPEQTLRYKLEQESIYDGVKEVRSSFAEDVFVHVVNKTGNRYWLKVKINSLPSSRNQKFSFLVRVDLDKQNSKNFGQEERFSVFTLGKTERSREMDFYIYNFLFQLIPVVKLDLFEILLSQTTTRKHEVTIQDSVLFPGVATMEQNIRSSEGQIIFTSKIKPEWFTAFGSTKTRPDLPRIEMTFEEDASISKSSGMLKTSDVELEAKIPIEQDLGSNPGIRMKFRSSLRFVEEVTSKKLKENMKDNDNYVKLPRPSSKENHARLRYFFPTDKKYDENSNVVKKVQEMLSLTSSSHSAPKDKDVVEFAKSFHKIVKPGQQEVNFAAAEKSQKKMGHLESVDDKKWLNKPMRKQESRQKWHENDRYQSNDDRNDDDGMADDEGPNDEDRYDGDDQRWNNRSGLAVPMYPEDRDSQNDEDDDYRGPEDNDEEVDDDDQPTDTTKNKDNKMYEPKNNAEATKPSKKDDIPVNRKTELRNPTNLEKDGNKDKERIEPKSRVEHSSPEGTVLKELKEKKKEEEAKGKEADNRENKPHFLNQVGTKSPTKNRESKKIQNVTPTASTTPSHEQSFFSDIFDRLWNDDDEGDDNHDNEYKFPPPIPFSFSSHFPFLHLRWPSFDDRKRRSLETNPQSSRKPRDDGHRDKRRLFWPEGGTKRPHYTGEDLETVWDVISYAKSNVRPKKKKEIIEQRIFGLEFKGVLEHEVQVVSTRDDKTEWVIRMDLSLNVGEHRFQVLSKTYTMKEIEERFIKHSMKKLEYGTVHAGTLVLCTPLFYIENICIEIQLGFVIHISHNIEHMTKEFPVELSIFFKHLTRVDAVISSHMDTLLGSSGVFSHGAVFGAKIPLEVKFSEKRSSSKWCSVANVKTKKGHFYETRNEMSQWRCQFDQSTNSRSNCTGLDENDAHKTTRLWYMNGSSKELHFLNNC
ncbi:uncharacterized protein LOC116286481 [Actinia tenebrosa]|uniref:Uncharacterized protein LOC116286481 n=1 Tax=Actinia tenebrosa TaxID=6105 RepID=A0A6P8GZC5_ACTTE|nr:uncharacterized protein LOC116286481 [Actinia tenebrosa]